MIWILSCALAFGVEVDRAPSGTIVTVRPETGEKAAVIDAKGNVVSLPDDNMPFLWLVHPDAWRKAVAIGEKYGAQVQISTELKAINASLETELAVEKKLRSQLRLDLTVCESSREAEVKALRRSRAHWALGAGATGLLVGGLSVAVIAL